MKFQVFAKFTISAALLALTQTAHADTIKCFFTEPFLVTEYNMSAQTLTTVHAFTTNPKDAKTVEKNVSFQIKGAGQFELLGKDHKVILELNLNNKGSDGMSDIVYPYDAKLTDKNLYGGCESNFLKKVQPKN